MKEKFYLLLLVACSITKVDSQVIYPYPLQSFTVEIESKRTNMAYMDVPGNQTAAEAILLLHGKNFNGFYWKSIIPALTAKGYRVIIPDQIGWGRSDKPNVHYSFHMLARNTKLLLGSLGIEKVIVIGHSMGGMLAARFTLLYPNSVKRLILENPIGLEDYRTFVPYQPLDSVYAKERKATFESYKKYQQSYFPAWKPEYEQYVQAQAESLGIPGFDSIALANAITYQMIYEQPVVYEFKDIKVPVLLVIGQSDRTIVGKDLLNEKDKQQHGQYPQLGRKIKALIPKAELIEMPGVGHIPHIQQTELFLKVIFNFLQFK